MTTTSVASFFEALRQSQVFDSDQIEELKRLEELSRQMQDRFPEPNTVADELIQRGWITRYQANQILEGKGRDLILGQYVLLDLLGEGGMGQVYKARQRRLKRLVALKVIRKECLEDQDSIKRFHREAEAAAKLSHPNIVTVYDADEISGTHYIAMEFIEGIDLSKLVQQSGPLPVGQACEYIGQAALGLQHAHERGMVHRDIKPHNLLVTMNGTLVKVLDMGIARLDRQHGVPGGTLTQTGTVMGTPDYLSPEQATDSHHVTICADIYSLGCTLYFLLSGRAPFKADSLAKLLLKHQMEEATPLRQVRGDVPVEVEKVVKKMMAKRPEDRYQTPAEVAVALEPFVHAEAGERAIPKPEPPILPPRLARNAPSPSAETPAAMPRDRTVPGTTSGTTPIRKSGVLPRPVVPARRNQGMNLGIALGGALVVGLIVALIIWSFLGGSAQDGRTMTNSIGMKFAAIPGGTFTMGSPLSEAERHEGEEQHEVTVAPFHMSVREVTQGQYQQVIGKNPSWYNPNRGGTPDHPVDNLTWKEAEEFCRKLSELPAEQQAGRSYRLPTEAEWEFACRAGSQSPFHYGECLTAAQANFKSEEPYPPTADKKRGPGQTARTGIYPPNPWGLLDLHGNVWEWCLDHYQADYYRSSPGDNPRGPAEGKERVLRGGSWAAPGGYCRSAYRHHLDPAKGYPDVGFRVVWVTAPTGH